MFSDKQCIETTDTSNESKVKKFKIKSTLGKRKIELSLQNRNWHFKKNCQERIQNRITMLGSIIHRFRSILHCTSFLFEIAHLAQVDIQIFFVPIKITFTF